eukprot:15332623-Ditylum_brightwellii.AAC.1
MMTSVWLAEKNIGPVLHFNVIGAGSKTCRAGTQSMIQQLIKGFCITSGELILIFAGHEFDQQGPRISTPYPPHGPWPLDDKIGFR